MSNPTSEYDAIIVGARVAGCVTAALLAEQGHRVLLLDRTHFPSDTISTHFFRAPALRVFDQIGVYEEVEAAAPHLTVNYNVIDGIAFPEPVDRPDDYPFYLCIRRITLDDILARHIREVDGVEFHEGAKVDALVRQGDRVVGVEWIEDDTRHTAKAKAVIGADGVNSFVAKEAGAHAEVSEPVNRAMYYAYYRNIPLNDGPAAEFHYRGNTLAYVFPCDSDLSLIAVSIPIAEFAEFKSNAEASFAAELQAMTEIAPRMANAEREGPVRGSGSIPGYMRVPYGEGWALVGDAAMIMDPWSGQGIDQATTHAAYLSDHLDDYLTESAGWEEAMSAYHQERNAFSRKTFDRTCTFSRDLRPMTRMALEKRGLH